MAYPLFHKIHPELQGSDPEITPAFHDTGGSPVYEDGYGGLISHIIAQNDIAALRLYQDSPDTKVFWGAYERPSWHPFIIAARCGSLDALRELLEIYLTDPVYTEPLDQYLERLRFSPINVACAAANWELTLWSLHHHTPPLSTLHDRDTFGETPLFSAACGLRRYDEDRCIHDSANPSSGNISKHEDFIYFLLDQGCSVRDSNIYNNDKKQREEEENPDDSSTQPPSELEWTVLGAAITHASYEMVSRLIAEGANVYARQKWWDPTNTFNIIQYTKGVTPLHIASLFWNLEGIHALVDHGGDDVSVAEMVSSADSHGRLPLHWALLGNWNEEDSE